MAPALPVASMTTSQPPGRSSSSARAAAPRAAEEFRGLQALRVDVQDFHRGGAGALGQLQHHQAHRPGAVDEDLGPEVALQDVVPADRAGERFDQGRVGDVDVFGEFHAVGDRGDGELGRSTGDGDADRGPVVAEVAAAGAAVAALVAVQRGVDGHLVADGQFGDVGADGDDLALRTRGPDDRQGGGELPWRMCRSVPQSPQDATFTTTSHAAGRGVVDRGDGHFAGGLDDGCPHLTAPSERPWTSLSWAA